MGFNPTLALEKPYSFQKRFKFGIKSESIRYLDVSQARPPAVLRWPLSHSFGIGQTNTPPAARRGHRQYSDGP